MPLKLSLKPGEKFVLNGAVVQNGDRRSALLLQNKASVLREKDIMQADEATTPSRRIYFPVMMMYLDQAECDRLPGRIRQTTVGIHGSGAQSGRTHGLRQYFAAT